MCNSSFIPQSMSIETAVAFSLVIAVLVAGIVIVMKAFAALTPSQRRDVTRFVERLLSRSRRDR